MDLFERGRIQCIFEESVRMVELGRSFLDCGYFKKWAIPGLFFSLFLSFSTLNSKYVRYKTLPKTGFELRTLGIGKDPSTNRATTTF